MRAWKCTVCNYVHKGESPRKNVRSAGLVKINSWKSTFRMNPEKTSPPLLNRKRVIPKNRCLKNLNRNPLILRHMNPCIRSSRT